MFLLIKLQIPRLWKAFPLTNNCLHDQSDDPSLKNSKFLVPLLIIYFASFVFGSLNSNYLPIKSISSYLVLLFTSSLYAFSLIKLGISVSGKRFLVFLLIIHICVSFFTHSLRSSIFLSNYIISAFFTCWI